MTDPARLIQKQLMPSVALLQVTDPATHVQKQILMPSSGEAMPGEIVAIIGPSGAGACVLSICYALTLYCMLWQRRCCPTHSMENPMIINASTMNNLNVKFL